MKELNELKDIINKNHLEVKQELTKINTHNIYTKEKIEEHGKVIEDYKKHKGYVYGGVISLSAIFGFIGTWLKDNLFK